MQTTSITQRKPGFLNRTSELYGRMAFGGTPRINDLIPSDAYASNPPASGQMMMSSPYSPVNATVPGNYQPNASSAFSQYSGASPTYSSVNQYHAGNGTQAAVLNAPPTPQFVQSSLGPPSPAALGSPFSTPQFSNATAYAHHVQSPQLSSATHQTARTVYVGNIPPDTPVSDILDHVKTGIIDSVRPLPEKNCIFITFVEAAAAAQFFHETSTKKLIVNGAELKIGWGRPSAIPANIQMALQNGASRNVFLGSLDESVNEQYLRENLARFGQIEHIKIIKDKSIAFVHFLSTSNAIKCVTTLPTESNWASRRVNYGRDRCAPSTKSSNASVYLAQPIYPSSGTYQNTAYQVRFPSVSYDPYTGAAVEVYQSHPAVATTPVSVAAGNGTSLDSLVNVNPLAGVANRTIYLGNIHPDTTCEEICNVIRGGILSHIRYMPDKHIAFVTFVDPALALHFYNQSMYNGLVIKNRRLKIGWGKASALSPTVIAAVQNGGSRNVYLGNIDDTITEEKLKQDFSDYGEIELVNTLKEKNCAFVNFTSIAAAVRAIEGIRSKEEYKKFRINYGKDRCGNPPRTNVTNRGAVQSTIVDPATVVASPTTPSSTTNAVAVAAAAAAAVAAASLTGNTSGVPAEVDLMTAAAAAAAASNQQGSGNDTPQQLVPDEGQTAVNGMLDSVLVPNG